MKVVNRALFSVELHLHCTTEIPVHTVQHIQQTPTNNIQLTLSHTSSLSWTRKDSKIIRRKKRKAQFKMTPTFLILILTFSCQAAMAFQPSSVLGATKRLHQLKSALLDEPATSTSTTTTSLPPVLQDMIKERREFELNLGKAMDTLRKDYPVMLHKSPGK